MSPHNKRKVIPLAGLYSSAVLSALFIHYWFADVYARICDTSHGFASSILGSLLALFVIVRTILIWQNKDGVTKWIDALLARDKKK